MSNPSQNSRPQLKFDKILYGGDYNPEQWPRETWQEDMNLMKQAGVNIVTLPVFGWGNIQLSDDSWNFEWLDEVMNLLEENEIQVCLATATAATPPWVDRAYPEILRTNPDGVKTHHGGRHTFCPHSPQFHRLSTGLARKMAERYGHRKHVVLWHVSNEYGSPCYCDLCSKAFRTWLMEKYGSLKELNFRWNTAFWGQTFGDWEEIESPVTNGQRNFMGLLIDYDRFQSESILLCCEREIKVLREVTPNIPVTTNMMGAFKPLDYQSWAKYLDIIGWDCYPERSAHFSRASFNHSLMRGLKLDRPWLLMEQTPSQQNWQAYNSLKRPGVYRLWSYQAIAHGSNAAMFFQWRKSPGAQEMFHGAVVEHSGRTDARVFREVAELGNELKTLPVELLKSRVNASVALLFDWENWWAVEHASGPSKSLKYLQICHEVYQVCSQFGLTIDVVSPLEDLSKYKLVIAPVLKMIKPGVAEKLKCYTADGGTLLGTFFTGITDETDRTFSNGYPGPLSDLFGIWVEEFDALAPTEKNSIQFNYESGESGTFDCHLLCDIIHLEGADSIGDYSQEFYAGTPAVTRHQYSAGWAYYIGSMLSQEGLKVVLGKIVSQLELPSLIASQSSVDVECTVRESSDSGVYLFVMNHSKMDQKITTCEGMKDLLNDEKVGTEFTIPPFGVRLLRPLDK